MPSPVVQELLIGVLGGILTVPAYFLIWPALPLLSRLTIRRFGYGFVTSLLGLVSLLVVALAIIGIPMQIAQAVLARWQWSGMEVHATIIAGRTYSAAGMVYFIGLLVGISALMPLGKLRPIRRLHQRWEAWVDRLHDQH